MMNWEKLPIQQKKKVGKWVSGNLWVTLWNNGDVYHCIAGEPQGKFSGTPEEAKAYIEQQIEKTGR